MESYIKTLTNRFINQLGVRLINRFNIISFRLFRSTFRFMFKFIYRFIDGLIREDVFQFHEEKPQVN